MDATAAHFLIIDNQAERRQLLAQIVAQASATADTATNFSEALDMLDEQSFALILLATTLEDMPCDQVLERLKVAGFLGSIPVVIIVPPEGTACIADYLKQGAYDYITEPLLPEVVATRIRAGLLQRQLAEQAPQTTPQSVQQTARNEQLQIIERDMEIARNIQLGFLPNELPELPGWEIATSFHPAREVAGDFYDSFMLINNRRVAFVIADVCDKGVGSAMFMALSCSLIRAYSRVNYDLNWTDVLTYELPNIAGTGRTRSSRRMAAPSIGTNALKNSVVMTNEYITSHHLGMNYFVTLFVGIFDPNNGHIIYINGGHDPPMIVNADGVIKETLEPTGPLVGVFPGANYEIAEAQLEPGDMIFCYTDGVTDARNPQREIFGKKRLLTLLEQPASSATMLLNRFETDLYSHIGSALQFDDITMLAIRREPEPPQPDTADE